MNNFQTGGILSRVVYQVMLRLRWFGTKRVCKSFGTRQGDSNGGIGSIVVINLDRQPKRWQQIRDEFAKVQDENGNPLSDYLERFSAVDSKRFTTLPENADLTVEYTLQEQLEVDPYPALKGLSNACDQKIQMTRQEIAVAMSHIDVWHKVAVSEREYTLVLEDDVFMRRGFASKLDCAWQELSQTYGDRGAFDLLYLSFREVENGAQKQDISNILFRPVRGLWYLSGYVLSKRGARTLLKLLPARGPIDLWINHQFPRLDVFATRQSILDQRLDGSSDNSYSILPVLSKVGLFEYDGPSRFSEQVLRKPVFVFGEKNSGLTSTAMALSMLGYRCCSDITMLPDSEYDRLLRADKGTVFDAFCNIGNVCNERLIELVQLYESAKFILTVPTGSEKARIEKQGNDVPSPGTSEWLYERLRVLSADIGILAANEVDKWNALERLLDCQAPISDYPNLNDIGQRETCCPATALPSFANTRCKDLKHDTSTWNIPLSTGWRGVPVCHRDAQYDTIVVEDNLQKLCSDDWRLLNDTFPGNLAMFSSYNFRTAPKLPARLLLTNDSSGVRSYRAASLASQESYLFGSFSAEIRPASISGTVTGIFLHRNSPRQEIDVEFLGKDTTKMLVNVFYNPGALGSRFDFGYRGSPALVELGFDASKDFHRYSIEWNPNSLRWFVDGMLVHERCNWHPSPIPQLPMHFYINYWPSRSEELAGRLNIADLPSSLEVRHVEIRGCKTTKF